MLDMNENRDSSSKEDVEDNVSWRASTPPVGGFFLVLCTSVFNGFFFFKSVL